MASGRRDHCDAMVLETQVGVLVVSQTFLARQ